MMKEFAVTVVGVCSLVASTQVPQRRIRDFRTLMVLDGIDEDGEKSPSGPRTGWPTASEPLLRPVWARRAAIGRSGPCAPASLAFGARNLDSAPKLPYNCIAE